MNNKIWYSFNDDGFNDDGWHKLHIAAALNDTKSMETILTTTDVDVQARNEHKKTAIHCACDKSAHDAVKLLLERGANVNQLCGWKTTPLHAANFARDREMVKILLAAKADPRLASFQGYSVCDLASDAVIISLLDDFLKIQPSPIAPPAPNPFLISTALSTSSTASSALTLVVDTVDTVEKPVVLGDSNDNVAQKDSS